MSSGTQVDLDWAGNDAAQGGAAAPPVSAPKTGATKEATITVARILSSSPRSQFESRPFLFHGIRGPET